MNLVPTILQACMHKSVTCGFAQLIHSSELIVPCESKPANISSSPKQTQNQS